LLVFVDEDRPRALPIVTLALIGLCFLVFAVVAVVTLTHGPEVPVRWFAALALAPDSIRWYTSLTYWLLHEHLLHLSVNMLLLLVFGSCLEGGIGSFWFLALFLVGAAATGLAEAAACLYAPIPDRSTMVIGASGAVACILGAFASRYHRSRIRLGGTRLSVPAMPLIALLALSEVLSVGLRATKSGTPGVPANWAHILGFLFGIVWDQTSSMLSRIHFARTLGRADGAEGLSADDPRDCPERWQEVLEKRPHDPDALVRLPLALAADGDDEKARVMASWAIEEALSRHDKSVAAARFVRLKALDPHVGLKEREQMDLAGALEDRALPEQAAVVYEHIARVSEDRSFSAMATVRLATCLIRSLGRPADAAATLRAFLGASPDASWRAYAERLLREANDAASNTGSRPTGSSSP